MDEEAGLSHRDVASETEIRGSLAQVAAYLTNPERTSDWSDHVSGVWWLSEPTLAVGSRLELLTHVPGKPMEFRCQVKAFDPEGELVMRSDEGPVALTIGCRWESNENGATRVRLRHEADLTGLRSLGLPIAAPQLRHAQEHDLAKLKRLVEATAG